MNALNWIQDAREEIKTAWDTEFVRKDAEPKKEHATLREPPVIEATLIRVCAWCWPGDTVHKAHTLPDLPISHGICPACKQTHFGK